jgi:hypothetical protein
MVVGLVFAGSMALVAQQAMPKNLAGDFDDTTPSPAGSWRMGGGWTLQVKGESGKADFTAALTMFRSDYWVISTAADATNPATRGGHTHHVGLEDGLVSEITDGFRVSGMARVTGNGNLAFGGPVLIQVDITGGNSVSTSNIKLTFGGAGAGHFGPQAINGVVRTAK